jgi:uncharacterized membrane protein
MTKRDRLITAAMAGLLGAAVLAAPGSAKDKKPKGQEKCYGINSCGGKGDCGGKGHACAGKNSCKGQGWINLPKGVCERIQGGTLTAPADSAPAPEKK